MKLLIVTQVLDEQHPVLGFFNRWVLEFAMHCEHVQVIALQVGKHNLPTNVTVHSLGKEAGKGRLSYLVHFYSLMWSLRKEYDAVFVHMIPLYVILGAPVWKLTGKKITLWYTHGAVSLSLRLAERLVDAIFTAAKEGFNLVTKKVLVTGHGIDTEDFKPLGLTKDLDLVTVGRITPSKNLSALVDMVEVLNKTTTASLTVVGAAGSDGDKDFASTLRAEVNERGLESSVVFAGAMAHSDLPILLNRVTIFVTAAQNGSLDKAVLEAMACGLPVVSMAPGTASLSLGTNQVTSSQAMADAVIRLRSNQETGDGITYVASNHSLASLVVKIVRWYEN